MRMPRSSPPIVHTTHTHTHTGSPAPLQHKQQPFIGLSGTPEGHIAITDLFFVALHYESATFFCCIVFVAVFLCHNVLIVRGAFQ